MNDRPDVLIVGAGIAGLGLARALQLAGVPCTVTERAPGLPGLGLGINLPGNAVRVLADLGVADQVMKAGTPIHRREYRNSAGRLLFEVDESAFWAGVAPSVCIRRGDLVRILAGSLSDDPGHQGVRWDGAVTGLAAHQAAVRVGFARRARESYGFVVGADGVNSTVRRSVAPDAVVHASRMTRSSWRFVVPNPGVEAWTSWSGAAGTFLLIPLPNGQVYGYAAASRGGGVSADASWLEDTFGRFPAPVREAVDSALQHGALLHQALVQEVDSPRWSYRRMALIGDAAHATGPVWAQGAALGLEDAVVLADLLASRSDWSEVGAAYESARRARVEQVRRATNRMSRVAALPAWLRDLIVGHAGPKTYRETYGRLREPYRLRTDDGRPILRVP
ncbi:MAG TPA: FAD-dependent monooxygenase [Kribbella sp.]|nr:FAD-dependent monooxygenase [Kribbella sp.]